ncbi:MAG: hypothetical protein ACK40G_07365 [Cytophagaceae bacterium]
MKTKVIFFLFFGALFFSIPSFAQTHQEISKLDKELDLKLDTAAKYMILYILTGKEEAYDKSQEVINECEQMNDKLAGMLKNAKGLSAQAEAESVEENKEEIKAYRDPKVKADVSSATDKDKTLKVKFKHVTYDVSPAQKKRYEQFSIYLPKN